MKRGGGQRYSWVPPHVRPTPCQIGVVADASTLQGRYQLATDPRLYLYHQYDSRNIQSVHTRAPPPGGEYTGRDRAIPGIWLYPPRRLYRVFILAPTSPQVGNSIKDSVRAPPGVAHICDTGAVTGDRKLVEGSWNWSRPISGTAPFRPSAHDRRLLSCRKETATIEG